jgi:four helix bundle protein
MPTRTTRRPAAPPARATRSRTSTRAAPSAPDPPRVKEPAVLDAPPADRAPTADSADGSAATTPGYRGLRVWQRAIDLAAGVYALTAAFPADAHEALAVPLRRAAAAVPAGIAEGNVRYSAREYTHYLAQSLGTLAEVETLLHLAVRLELANEALTAPLTSQCTDIGRMLRALNRSVQTGAPARSKATPA